MATDLDNFIGSFSSESELRERIAGLFSRMPGIQGVKETHGPQEYGKDIVFYSQDALENWLLNACVIKNDKITGAADGITSARNVFVQVEQALDTPLISASGEDQSVAHVYVISPYECPQTTMRAIQGKLKGRSGQVTFLCGRALLEKFAKYWPEFVAFETTILNSYIARQQHSFDDADPIAFLMSQHQVLSSGSKSLEKVYIRQRFHRCLRQFRCVVEVPHITLVQGLTSDEHITRFAQELTLIAGLLKHPEVWDPLREHEAEPTSSELLAMADSIRASWKAEYETYRSERQRRGDHVLGKHQVQLSLKLDDAELASLLDRVSRVVGAFEARLEESNQFAASCKSVINCLGTTQHLGYCGTEQVVNLAPTHFVAISPERDLFMPEDLLEKIDVALLVTAPAGYGKTSFCKWNFMNDVRRFAASESETIPVYVPLHQLATAPATNIKNVFLRSEDVARLIQSAKDNSRRIRFYLDGLDEVSTIDQQRKLMDLASRLPAEFPTAHVIVTGRDYVTGHWLGWLARVNLAELTDAQVDEFIAKWLGDDPQELKSFREELEKTRTLLSLMKVPLLGTLIISVFRKMRSLPENKVKLYEIFVDLMCGGWDVAKNVPRDTKFGSNAKLSILTRLAGHLHINERRQAEESDIRAVVKEAFPAALNDWRTLFAELLEDGLLVRLASGAGFAHLSFQEYLASRDLATDPTGERQKLVLRRFLGGQDWWREVLAFYFSTTQRPDEVAGWIKTAGSKISRDLRSQDIGKRWEFMMGCLQEAAPGWAPPDPGPLIRT